MAKGAGSQGQSGGEGKGARSQSGREGEEDSEAIASLAVVSRYRLPTTLLGERDDVVLLVFGDECLFETAKAVDGLLAQMGQQGVAFPGIVSLLRDLRLTCFPLIGKSALEHLSKSSFGRSSAPPWRLVSESKLAANRAHFTKWALEAHSVLTSTRCFSQSSGSG